MLTKNILAAGITAVTMATGASAATFDFVALADAAYADAGIAGANIEATFDQAQPTGWTVDGITVNATGYAFFGEAHAFLDSNNAGLGVCSSGFAANGNSACATGNPGSSDQGDDNVTFAEGLELSFSTSVSLVDMVFRDAVHDLANGPIWAFSDTTAGAYYSVTNGALAAADIAALGVTSMFTLEYDNSNSTATEFYVSSIEVSAVPLPASMAFLLAGLGGLGLAKRRRKAA